MTNFKKLFFISTILFIVFFFSPISINLHELPSVSKIYAVVSQQQLDQTASILNSIQSIINKLKTDIQALFGREVKAATETIGLVRQDCTGYSNCFTSLSAWEAAYGGIAFGACAVGDLVCADKVAIAQIDGAWTSADTTAVTIDGWTTDATHYIRIYTTAAARHNGKWDNSKYYMSNDNVLTGLIDIREQYVRIEGLQLSGQSGGSIQTVIGLNFSSATAPPFFIEINKNIIRKHAGNSNDLVAIGIGYGFSGLYIPDGSKLNIYNNIIYDFSHGSWSAGGGIYFGVAAGYSDKVFVYNNTINNSNVGIGNDYQNTRGIVAKNNIIQGSSANGNFAYFSAQSPSNYNISYDNTAPGANSKNSTTVSFLDATNKDFHLSSSDTSAKDAGTNLSADPNLAFSDDIDGNTRPIGSAWDIGADEESTVAPPSDTTPSVLSSGSPTGALSSGTTQTTLSLTTDENATCKYGTTLNTAYGSIANTFTTTGGISHSQTITGLTNGTSYNYYVRCQDTAGNANTTDYIISFSVSAPAGDITSPTISVTSPISGTTVSGTITISANASDNVAVAGVQFKLDTTTNLGTEDTTSPYSYSLNTTTITDGSHTLTTVARDTSNNYATSSIITITVNNASPPPLDITSPSIPTGLIVTTISSSQINLSWTASTDDVGVTGYKIYRCAGLACAPTIQIATSVVNSYSNTGLTASTAYTYAVSAYDAGGNNSAQSVNISATTSSQTSSTINIPWDMTFNCAEMSQLSPGGPAYWISNCDGLTGGGGWTTSSGNVEAITTAANYPGGVGGRGQRHWIGPGKNNSSGSIAHQFTTRQTELWMRWYMRYEKGYQIDASFPFIQKQLYFDQDHYLAMFGDRWKVLIAGTDYIADAPGGFAAHFGGGTAISHGGWVCIEYHFKVDNPQGSNNGIVELWVNDAPIFSQKNVNLRLTNLSGYSFLGWPENATGSVGVPDGSGGFRDGYQDLDDKVVSNTGRIGCINSPQDITPPTTPTNLTATPISSSQINLSWTASTDNVGVTDYKIYRCAGSACAPTVQIATSAVNSYSNTGLTASTAYTYAVSAYDAAGNESGKSVNTNATTLSQTSSTVNVLWQTTYNCPENSQFQWFTNGVNCDGLIPGGAWTTTNGNGEQITTAANYPGGGGGRGQRQWNGDGNNNNSGATNISFTSSKPELWIRWYMRYQAGYKWSFLNYDKILYIHAGAQTDAITEFYGADGFQNYAQGGSGNAPCSGCGWTTVHGGPISDGSWHAYEIHIKMDTNGANGISEFWLDGVKKLSLANVNFGTKAGWTGFTIGENQASPNNGQDMYVDFDDLVVSTTSYIGPISGSDATAPTAPSNLTATVISSTQINLSWTASTDDVGVTGYKIYRCLGSACAPTTQIATSTTTSYSDTGLTTSTTYTYAVSAYDAAGNESAKSSSVSVATPSLAPQCSDTIDNDSDGKIDYPLDPDCSSLADNNESDTTPPTISSVISTTLASTTARIDWQTNEPATSQVEYGFTTQYGTTTTFNSTLTTSHSVQLSNLSPDSTTYNYRVRSKDSSGNESISTNNTFITPGLTDTIPPASTTNLKAENITQTSVNLVTWTAPGDDNNQGTAYQFDIRYTQGELSENTWNNGGVIRATGEPTPKPAGSLMSYTLVGLTPNTTYKAALKTLDEVSNQSLISNIITFTTLKAETAPSPSPTPSPTPSPGGGGGGGGLVSDTTPPAQPKNFKTISADKQIILQWKNPPDLDFVRIIIIRKENSLPTSKEDGAIIYEGTNQEFTDINLNNDKTYYYAIYAYDKTSNYSTLNTVAAKPEAGKISIPLERTIEPTIPFPNGSLLKTADSDKIYFIVNNKKRWLTNPEVFISYGFTPNSQITVQKAILDQYEEEKAIIKPSYSEGTLVRASNDFKVYIIKPPYKRHIFNPAVFTMYKHFDWNSIREIDQDTLDSYITSDLYRAENDPKVYSLEEIDEVKGIAKKRWLDMTPEDFVLAGYNWNQVFVINPRERDYYQEGEVIKL